jgi:K+-transporting ATPase KdpF subunit
VEKEGFIVPLDMLLALVVAVLLVIYLTYALLQAEKF